jgi:tyrosine-specific transport protein
MQQKKNGHKRSVMSAIFLVAGTCVGGGMLALPIATGISGFLPSMVVMAVCWFVMTFTALLLLEVSLWMEEGAHIITMTSRILGPWGQAVSWLLYLFICYASNVAYTAGGGIQIASALHSIFDWSVSREWGCLIFIILFGSFFYIGNWLVGRINAIVFIGMIAAYFWLVIMGLDEVKTSNLLNQQWKYSLIALPLLLTSFSFQTMVPSLTPYLKRNVNGLKIAIVAGTTLSLVIYAIWQWLILGIVPVDGPKGLSEALTKGDQPATQFLHEHVHGTWITLFAEYFAFFAIVTSFLGITLGLFDFLSDGLKIKKNKTGKMMLGLLIALPTLLFATQFEKAFIAAMDISGGFGDTILNGLIPVFMVWRGRYYLGYSSQFRTPGGKTILVLVGIFFSFALTLEILAILGFAPSLYEASYDIIHNPERA